MPIDPITLSAIISTAGQVGGQVASNIGSKKREAEYKAKADVEQKKFDLARERIANIDFSPGSGIYELEQQRKQQAELLGSEADRRGDEREARALAALQDSPRQMQAIAPRIISQSEDAAQKADLQVGQLKVDATKATTAAEQAAEDQARKRDMMLDQLDMQRAGKSFDTFTEGVFGERAARAEGNRALISELGETAIAVGGNIANVKSAEAARDAALAAATGTGFTGQTKTTEQTDESDTTTDTTTDATTNTGIPDYTYILDNAYDGNDSVSDAEIDATNQQLLDGTYGLNAAGMREEINPYTGLPYILEQGGYIGKDGGITEGEFSHKTNKKAVIDQESGIKEAELTGGEGIVNPDQFKDLMSVKELLDKLSAKPSAPAEIKKAAELLKFLEGEQFQDA